jgi:hypothetical protein
MMLEIEFRSGDLYDYYEVPASVFEQFRAASSKGQFFQAHIRDRYRYQQVR